jgi:hypothetical protein
MLRCVATPLELIEQAQALDNRASAADCSEHDAEQLRKQAAELRKQSLGERPYPVLICGACLRLTGWLTEAGLCVFDAERLASRETTGFYDVRDASHVVATPPSPAWRRAAHALGVTSKRDRAKRWLLHVDPDRTGPVDPEDGFELEAAVRSQRPKPEGVGSLVCFDSQSVRFEYSDWREIPTTHGGKPRVLVPREFPASLPMEQLAEAWADFCEEVADHNAEIWDAQRSRRDQAGQRTAEQQAADELERGTSSLLN